ncbi:MAG: hypothetical protein KKG00_08815 [Bacteroidetes bacterium]|nr:hypothetical protein [Bacteroidota bacterium]
MYDNVVGKILIRCAKIIPVLRKKIIKTLQKGRIAHTSVLGFRMFNMHNTMYWIYSNLRSYLFILFTGLTCAFLLLTLPLIGYAQLSDSQYYMTISSKSVNFSYTSSGSYEAAKNLHQAFDIKIRATNSNYSLYVRMERTGGTGISQLPASIFFVQVDDTTPAKNVPMTPYYLTPGDQLLFTERNTTVEDRYKFDFGHDPLGYNYKAGQYTYLITFTLTSP